METGKMKMKAYLVPPDIYETFKIVCEEQCTTPSKIIRRAIKEYIRDNNKKK